MPQKYRCEKEPIDFYFCEECVKPQNLDYNAMENSDKKK
jgi:hypothetical protein